MKDLLWGLGFIGVVFGIGYASFWTVDRSITNKRAAHLKEIAEKIEETDGTAKVVRVGDGHKFYSYIVVEFKNGERLKLEGYPELVVGDQCTVKPETDGISVKRIRDE